MVVLNQSTIWSKFSCRTGLIRSAVMKFSLIAAVVLLAVAQGSFAQEPDFGKLTEFIDGMKAKMNDMLSHPELATQAQTAVEGGRKILEPMASQVQEELKSAVTNVDDQIRHIQAQFQPMFEDLKQQMEEVIHKMTKQAKALQQ